MDLKNKAFSTRAVHAGERVKQGRYTPVASPIVPSVSYLYESMDELDAVFAHTQPGYIYARYTTPTVSAFEAAIANLEGGEAALAFASGMAAIHAALLGAGVRAGSNVVSAFDVYGATYSLLTGLFAELGVHTTTVDISDLDSLENHLKKLHPSALIVETVSNPLLKVADIPTLAEMAHRYKTQLLVDNTFTTPYLFQPLQHSADYVIHSATKYISGHGDVLAGIVVTSESNRLRMFETNKLIGGTLGPFEAWLALRGVKTLPLRVQQQFHGAAQIAQWLADQPEISRVNYPGLTSHPQHELAKRLFHDKGFGGMISFEIKDATRKTAFRFMESLELCLPATTLGDVYSLVLHPATSSHRTLSDVQRRQIGISDGLVRLSVGIEDPADIQADLEQALKRSAK